jgi:formate hydrogenlyase transcriptional activator
VVPIAESAPGSVFLTGETKVCNREDLTAIGSPIVMRMLELGIQSFCSIPLMTRKGKLGTLNLGSATDHAFAPADISFLKQVAAQVAIALDNARAYREIAELTDKLKKEKLYLQDEIRSVLNFEEIVGESPALKHVLTQVNTVAPLDATVLILGETGTGKELIARAVHKRSNRSARAFIRVNCAAISPSLITSELFGHEKGAFSGALQRRIGRFEAADGGTIFLDEIGDLSIEVQIALLRVLQEREFERVGSSQPLAVDVRVLVATNRDLKSAVDAGTFRQDLFYRLNVFPIHLPSLQERVDDIPLLVEYFVDRYAQKAGKKFKDITSTTLALFQRYHWPGNIRELQNVIERAVILCDNETFSTDETWLKLESPPPSGPVVPLAATLIEREKQMIEAALAHCQGRVSGPSGAADKLGIPRQTLDARILSLGINKHRFKTS